MNEIVGILAVTTVFADISGMYLCFSEKALRSGVLHERLGDVKGPLNSSCGRNEVHLGPGI